VSCRSLLTISRSISDADASVTDILGAVPDDVKR